VQKLKHSKLYFLVGNGSEGSSKARKIHHNFTDTPNVRRCLCELDTFSRKRYAKSAKTCITITCIPTLVRGCLCGVIILFRNTNINKLYTRMPDFLSVSVSGGSCDRDTQSLILSSLMYGSYLVLFLQYFKTTYSESENIQITVMEHEKAQ
jgi:hypothetical protein